MPIASVEMTQKRVVQSMVARMGKCKVTDARPSAHRSPKIRLFGALGKALWARPIVTRCENWVDCKYGTETNRARR